MNTENLYKRVDNEIPENGEWWDSDTGETYREAATELIKKGFTESDAIEFLSGLYHAAAAEFGG